MAPPHRPDLETALLDFQCTSGSDLIPERAIQLTYPSISANILRATFHLHRSSVDTSSNRLHRTMLDEIWTATGLDEDERVRWDILGLDVQGEGARARVVWKTGRLGLDSLVSAPSKLARGTRMMADFPPNLPATALVRYRPQERLPQGELGTFVVILSGLLADAVSVRVHRY